MPQNQAFVEFVLTQLHLALSCLAPSDGHTVEVRQRFNAVSVNIDGQLLALIANSQFFIQLHATDAAALLAGTKPFQPAGIELESHFYPMPIAWLADTHRFSQCLEKALQPSDSARAAG